MNWDALRGASKPIVLYGMGNGADRVLDMLADYGISASGVFASDEFVRGQVFRGFPVLTYRQAKERFGEMIVLLSFGSSIPEVLSGINVISHEQELYAPDFPVAGETLFTEEFYREHLPDFEEIYRRLADAQSRLVLRCVIAYKLTGRIGYLSCCQSSLDDAYTKLLRLNPKGEILADLGAYKGDSIAQFRRYCPDYAGIYAFEPDPYSFRRLEKSVGTLPNCQLLQAAAMDAPGSVIFSIGHDRGTKRSAQGREIPCESLDHVLQGKPATFLNIDVEGCEKEAIQGSIETIRRYKPKILLAAYHRSEDLFALTRQVLSIRDDYTVYLRRHAQLPAWDINFYFV